MKTRILITGASGFIGTHLVQTLLSSSKEVELVLVGRFPNGNIVGDYDDKHPQLTFVQTRSIELLQGEQLPESIDTVIHLAAKAHVTESDELQDEYKKVNTEGTRRIADIAQSKGVSHFIHLSTIKVNGDTTEGKAFSEADIVHPEGIYAKTKFEAESLLDELANSVRVSVVRPPLVYGRGVKANMHALASLIRLLPVIPFGAISNKRSLISVHNLTDFIKTLVWNMPEQMYTKEIFLVSDAESVSTPELCRKIAQALHKKVLLVALPAVLMKGMLSLVGKRAMWDKLSESLEVRGEHPAKFFKWSPPYKMLDELTYLNEESR